MIFRYQFLLIDYAGDQGCAKTLANWISGGRTSRPKGVKSKHSYSIIIAKRFEQTPINCVMFGWHKL